VLAPKEAGLCVGGEGGDTRHMFICDKTRESTSFKMHLK